MSVAKEGLAFIIIPLFFGIVLLLPGRGPAYLLTGIIFILVGLFCAFFFRDPSRKLPQGENLVLSPCDGTVLEIGEENNRKFVRVFLSVLNVHLQRSPVQGTIKSVEYRPGKFLPAMNKEAHLVNEQNVIILESKYGDFTVKQIAGILARRVVSRVKEGDRVDAGQKIGLIKFGSQVDLYTPLEVRIKVRVGDKVVAGETVMGEIQPL